MGLEFLKKSKTIEYEVQGEKVSFKGIPLKTIFKIRNLAEANKSISKLLAYWFIDKSKDAEIINTSTVADSEKELYNTATNVKSVEPQIAAMRSRDLEQGISGIQSLITSPESEELLTEIIYESAAKCWEGMTPEDARDTILGLDPAAALELLIGSLKASAGVIKVLGKWFPQIKNVESVLEEKLKDLG